MIPCAGSHFTGTNTPSGARWPVGAPCRLARTDRSRRQLRHRAVLLAPALGEHDLIAVGIPDDGQADLFRFGACNDLDPEFLQAGDAFRNIAFDERHRRSAGAPVGRDKRAEFAPPHSITSSARVSSVGGTSSLRASAGLRLMNSSIFVDCWTGRLASFSPLSSRPV